MPNLEPETGLRHAHLATSRRGMVAGSIAGIALAVSPLSLDSAEDEIRFGLTPVMLTSDLDLLETLRRYLEVATGRAVRLVTKRTYQEITALLVTGQLDAAWICGYPFIRYADRLSLVAVPVWKGQPLYRSYLIVGHDRKANQAAELAGDIHAFSDPDSNSGFLVTEALIASLERDPRTFFSRTFFTYGHRNVVRAVASGLAQSGSVDGYVWDVLSEVEPDMVGQTRILWRSELLGFPPIATSRSSADQPHVVALQQAFLAMSEDPVGLEVLSGLRLDGFMRGTPALFEGIARKYEAVRDLV